MIHSAVTAVPCVQDIVLSQDLPTTKNVYWSVCLRMCEIVPRVQSAGSFGGLKSCMLKMRHPSSGGAIAITSATENRGPWKYSILISWTPRVRVAEALIA